MKWAEARNELLSLFMTQFSDPDIVIGYDNSSLTPLPDKPWLRLNIIPAFGVQDTLAPVGDRKFRRGGVIGCSFAIPAGTWTAKCDEIAQKLIDVFESKTVNGIIISSGVYSQNGQDGNWFMAEVVFDFEFVDLK